MHLKGVVKAVDGFADPCSLALASFLRIATLPVGYRPDAQWVFPTVSDNEPGRVDVKATGNVEIASGFPAFADAMVYVSLDGISFRCAPSGANGCP